MAKCTDCARQFVTQAFETKPCKSCGVEFTAATGGVNYCNLCTLNSRCNSCGKSLNSK